MVMTIEKMTIFHTSIIIHKFMSSYHVIRIAQVIAHSIELKKIFKAIYIDPFFTSQTAQKKTKTVDSV